RIADDLALVPRRDAQINERLVAVVHDLVRVLRASRVRDPVTGADRHALLADPHGAAPGEDVTRFFVRTVVVDGKRALSGRELEHLRTELLVSGVPRDRARLHVELPLSELRRLDLVGVDDVRMASLRGHGRYSTKNSGTPPRRQAELAVVRPPRLTRCTRVSRVDRRPRCAAGRSRPPLQE